MTKASTNKLVIQSSTFEGAQELITQIMEQNPYVTATVPVMAADGSYLASVCIHPNLEETIQFIK